MELQELRVLREARVLLVLKEAQGLKELAEHLVV